MPVYTRFRRVHAISRRPLIRPDHSGDNQPGECPDGARDERDRKQTGYLFLSNNDVDIRRNVSVRIENGTLAEALGQMLKGSGVTYRLENKYISLSAAPRGGNR